MIEVTGASMAEPCDCTARGTVGAPPWRVWCVWSSVGTSARGHVQGADIAHLLARRHDLVAVPRHYGWAELTTAKRHHCQSRATFLRRQHGHPPFCWHAALQRSLHLQFRLRRGPVLGYAADRYEQQAHRNCAEHRKPTTQHALASCVEQKPSERDALRHYVWLRGESTAPSSATGANAKIVRWLSKTVWVKPVQSSTAEF